MPLGGGNALHNYEADGVPEERCVEMRNVPLEIWNGLLGAGTAVGEIQPGWRSKARPEWQEMSEADKLVSVVCAV